MTRLLIIDDDALVLGTIANQLESAGYQYDRLTEGRAALAAARKGKYDLILLDIMMPDLDGIEFITELHRERNQTPIVAMTGGMSSTYGHDEGDDVDRYLQFAGKLGANGVLRKPFTRQQLLDAIAACLPSAGNGTIS